MKYQYIFILCEKYIALSQIGDYTLKAILHDTQHIICQMTI